MTDALKLTRGSHVFNEGEACAMEYLSWTRLQLWSAEPISVSPAVCRAVQNINDMVPDELTRWRIVDEYGDRIMSASPRGADLVEFFRREIADVKAARRPADDYERSEYEHAAEILSGRYPGLRNPLPILASIVSRKWVAVGPGEALAFLDRLLAANNVVDSTPVTANANR